MAIGRRRRPAFWILLAFLFLGVVGQAVPLYTDWLWFQEVGYVDVFTRVLTLRGWLVIGLGLAVWAFLFANLWVAARVAPPDVLWELEDQLGLPGRASIEPLVRRLLVPVTALIAFGRFRRRMPAEPSLRAIRSPSATAASVIARPRSACATRSAA